MSLIARMLLRISFSQLLSSVLSSVSDSKSDSKGDVAREESSSSSSNPSRAKMEWDLAGRWSVYENCWAECIQKRIDWRMVGPGTDGLPALYGLGGVIQAVVQPRLNAPNAHSSVQGD